MLHDEKLDRSPLRGDHNVHVISLFIALEFFRKNRKNSSFLRSSTTSKQADAKFNFEIQQFNNSGARGDDRTIQ